MYTAYGLTIQSELDLPELAETEGPPDVTIARGVVDAVPTPTDRPGHGFWAEHDEACHFFENVGAFLVRGGSRIIVDPAPGAHPALVRRSILGPAMGLLLHQRGFLILHASAVMIGESAITFAGWRGWGKSTLAAVMRSRGHTVITDDVTAVDMSCGTPSILPGVPQVRLWPDVVKALGDLSEGLPELPADSEKPVVPLNRDLPAEPVALQRIYVLAEGPGSALDPLPPSEAILELIRHWYGGRFGEQLLAIGDTAAKHLRQCGDLVSSVPVRRLSRPRQSWSAESLADLVEADLAEP